VGEENFSYYHGRFFLILRNIYEGSSTALQTNCARVLDEIVV
jgi:hypothetical protein